MLQSLSTLQSRPPAVADNCADTTPDDPLLRFAGPIGGSHALVIAPNGLDVLCRLLRQGCSAATTLRAADRPGQEAFDLVLAPRVTAAIEIGRLVHQAKRALVPAGRFVAFVPHAAGEPEDDVGGLMIRTLRLAGFTSVRSKTTADGLLVRADFAMQEWSSAIAGRRQA